MDVNPWGHTSHLFFTRCTWQRFPYRHEEGYRTQSILLLYMIIKFHFRQRLCNWCSWLSPFEVITIKLEKKKKNNNKKKSSLIHYHNDLGSLNGHKSQIKKLRVRLIRKLSSWDGVRCRLLKSTENRWRSTFLNKRSLTTFALHAFLSVLIRFSCVCAWQTHAMCLP
jgi:hypothetical protein